MSSLENETDGNSRSFTSKDRLLVHEQKHQMTLKLGVKSANYLSEALTVDQTPTPTRFLQYGNQVGLFEELTNPFDRDFKAAQKEGSSKARRSNQFPQVPGITTSKVRTPTSPSKPSFSTENSFLPMHVITLTPSPVAAIPPNQFFVPPSLIPSPQPMLPNLPGFSGANSPMSMAPNHLLSPTLMQYPGLISVMSDSQRAAAQAMFAAANVSASSPSATMSNHFLATNSADATSSQNKHDSKQSEDAAGASGLNFLPKQERSTSSIASSISDDCMITSSSPLSNKSSTNSNVSAPSLSLNISSAASVNNKKSNESTAAGDSMSHAQLNAIQDVATSLSKSLACGADSIDKFPSSSSNIIDAKQKLKETLKINNPNLLQQNNLPTKDTLSDSCMSSISASHLTDSATFAMAKNEAGGSPGSDLIPASTTGRRRGRQSRDIDPDVKRQRFLERNRAAASRCRNKKKKWVHGLEQKAKNLCQTNMILQTEIASLKDEVASLKQLLLSHRDCPVTKMQQQRGMAAIKFDMLGAPTSDGTTSSSSSVSASMANAIKREVNSNTDSMSTASQLSRGRAVPSLSSLSNNPSVSAYEAPKSNTSQTQMQSISIQPEQLVYSQPDSNGMTPIYASRACS